MKNNDDFIVKKRIHPALLLCYVLACWSVSVCRCFQSKLLIRQIRSQPNNVTHALGILDQIDTNANVVKSSDKISMKNDKDLLNVVVAALRVCGNDNNPDLALKLYNKHQSEATRAMAISVLGSCQKLTEAVTLLDDGFSPPSAASFNAAIAACGKTKNWQLALDIYRNKMPKESSSLLSTNALLTVLAKCRKGKQALEVFENMAPGTNEATPGCDSVTYSLLTSALVRSNMLQEASDILKDLDKKDHHCSPKSIEAMNDLVLSAYSQRGDWNGVERMERIRQRNEMVDQNEEFVSSVAPIIQSDYRFHKWEGLQKMGKGKESYWVIGNYQNGIDDLNITVGCRPHRNPSRNGIQILFFDNTFDEDTSDWKQTKIGFLLMKNNYEDRTSSLLGMFLKPFKRGKGISKVCLAIWIRLCLEASILPVTGTIHKPLLALILQHTFGFTGPTKNSGGGGVLVELFKDPDNPSRVVLFPLSGKSLEGAFSPWDLEHQNIKITSRQPKVKGRVVRIGSKLYPPPDVSGLNTTCIEVLSKEFWTCNLFPDKLQLIFLGKALGQTKED